MLMLLDLREKQTPPRGETILSRRITLSVEQLPISPPLRFNVSGGDEQFPPALRMRVSGG
jgi:hypothetical protein